MKLSVIVPVYNVEAYLAECVESLLAQTMKDMEILLVDDGSTDVSGVVFFSSSITKAASRTLSARSAFRASAMTRFTPSYPPIISVRTLSAMPWA